MSQVDQPASTMLRSLKGAPLSIVVALATHGPQSQRGLMALTGWKKEAVRNGLERLVDEGLVVRCNYRTWALPEGRTLQGLLDVPRCDACEGVCEGSSDGDVRLNGHSDVREHHLSVCEGEAITLSDVRGDHLSVWEGEADAHSHVRENRLSEGEWAAITHSEVPENHLSDRERAAGSHSGDEVRPNGISALTRDDHDHDVDPFMNKNQHHSNKHGARTARKGDLVPTEQAGTSAQSGPLSPRMARLAQRLQMLSPPFAGAEKWLSSVRLQLVEAWLQHLEEIDGHERGKIRNEAAFLRVKVGEGHLPPRLRPAAREPCPRCGRAYFSREGVCLVCAGVVLM